MKIGDFQKRRVTERRNKKRIVPQLRISDYRAQPIAHLILQILKLLDLADFSTVAYQLVEEDKVYIWCVCLTSFLSIIST